MLSYILLIGFSWVCYVLEKRIAELEERVQANEGMTLANSNAILAIFGFFKSLSAEANPETRLEILGFFKGLSVEMNKGMVVNDLVEKESDSSAKP